MTPDIVKEPSLKEQERPDSPTVQIYQLPESFKNRLSLVFLVGLFFCAFGLAMTISAIRPQESVLMNQASLDNGWLACGLIIHILGLMGMSGAFMCFMSIARRVQFTIDSVIVSQFFRKDIRLPYHEYSFRWQFDNRPNGNIRLIMIEENRGCIIPGAPKWSHQAFDEIDRIQNEEGWYSPS